ncbi:hypothetical protein L6164_019336 [Bauhinia variegata]|uniref:Uncharacterized protein n=1 Tax=Bauhinia variegata TaxID=167791 RepID=A0ACB9MS76_BAUVA|nr:hypothetical protein L6164_019336 [Bauhinia variegata]
MGCGSSKHVDGGLDVYKPAAASLAVFDINAIEEPWLKQLNSIITAQAIDKEKEKAVPPPILHKLDDMLEGEATQIPQSWDEVSKALQNLTPALDGTANSSVTPSPMAQKRVSFHTVEELDAKLLTSKEQSLRKSESMRGTGTGTHLNTNASVEEFKPVKDNIFLVKDRLERSKTKDNNRLDPLSEYQQKCPPGKAAADGVVIYTTSLGGVRRTFDDCNRARDILQGLQVVFDERDVSLHAQFLNELKELLGQEEVALPAVFIKGRHIGGIHHLLHLNETGRLRRILNATRVERGLGRQACGGCGGARFVPCLECGGSCKLLLPTGTGKQRCPKCNENGLVHCPACLN